MLPKALHHLSRKCKIRMQTPIFGFYLSLTQMKIKNFLFSPYNSKEKKTERQLTEKGVSQLKNKSEEERGQYSKF
jgi:hypothetical protein